MKKKLKIFLLSLICFFICSINTNALELKDTLVDGQTIDAINSTTISIKSKQIEIEHFITNNWRTYVKLTDLCSNKLGVCNLEESTDEYIVLTKNYEDMDNYYYQTTYTFKTNSYESYLVTPNTLKFDFGETKTSPDVSPVIVDNELYVPLRFITEALGAEVIYDNTDKSTKPKINIDFYSNMDMEFGAKFYDVTNKETDSVETLYSELEKDHCYDIVAKINNETIHNIKLFSKNEEFIKTEYNNNVQTNICLNDNLDSDKSISFVYNYNGVPVIFEASDDIVEASNLDTLFLFGDTTGISKENEVKLKANYIGTKLTFDNKYATLKWQGHSSLRYDKKNYTIKLYEDSNYDTKYKIKINNWNTRNKYCLKANFIDYTQARNVVSAKLWGKVVDSRNSNTVLKGLVNGGAIDGYPIVVYINNEYQGLYTLNTCKDENLFTKDNTEPLIIYAATHFREDIWFRDEPAPTTGLEPWDLEYLKDDVNEQEMNTSLQNMVKFVFTSSDEEFKNNIKNYLDLEASIDYMIFMYYINGSDNASINTLWTTYDGKTWIPSAYDMDATFGLAPMGNKYLDSSHMLPSMNGTYVESNSDMMLWVRLLNVFTEEVKARAKELRTNILTTKTITNEFNKFINQIPKEEFSKDYETWKSTSIVAGEQMVTWKNEDITKTLIETEHSKIINYIKEREKLFDEFFLK